ncbi:hypothetical protein V6N13_104979 [Hibiscus sabdariffa]
MVPVPSPWLPPRCSHCGVFGHFEKTCHRKKASQTKVWVPKETIKGKDKLEPSELLVEGMIPSSSGAAKEIYMDEDSVHQAAVIQANAETKDEMSVECPVDVSVGGLTVASKEVPHSEPKLIREASRGVATLMKQLQQNKGSGKARDFNIILSNDESSEEVSRATVKDMHDFYSCLRPDLKELNSRRYGNITDKVKDKKVELEAIQLEILYGTPSASTGELLAKEKEKYAELHVLMKAEEIFLRQKSCISWIKKGDQNTNFFFHSMLAIKNNRHTIKSSTNTQGYVLCSQEEISAEAIGFYEKLYVLGLSMDLFKELMGCNFSNATKSYFQQKGSREKIKSSVFGQHSDKAHGPDEFTSHFYKVALEIVGEDVVQAVSFFFETSKLLPAWNATTLMLVPKVLTLAI